MYNHIYMYIYIYIERERCSTAPKPGRAVLVIYSTVIYVIISVCVTMYNNIPPLIIPPINKQLGKQTSPTM